MQKSLLYLALCAPLAQAWQGAPFAEFAPRAPQLFEAQATLEKGSYTLTFTHEQQCFQPQNALKLNQAVSLIPCDDNAPPTKIFRSGDYIAQIDLRSGTPTLQLILQKNAEIAPLVRTCPIWDGKPLEIEVAGIFAEGERVRDAYSQQQAQVKNGKISLQPHPDSHGLLLLEPLNAPRAEFDWNNATVYFVLTDRFYNGDTRNDHSYGRQADGMQEIGTFHGGDLVGLTAKLDYLQQLGVNAIWISSPLEQIHGWVGGGDKGDFPHYAYHGYYHLDWTAVDKNMGTEAELAEFIAQAHQRGMRVLFDVVLNHTGYATLADMQQFGFGAFYLKADEMQAILGDTWTNWRPKSGQNWHSFNDFINFRDAQAWQKWWGKAWVRADIGDYDQPRFNDLQMSLASLPDLKTEAETPVALPPLLQHKADSQAKTLENAKVRDYLIAWLGDWVRKYGIDGFRVDTAKHVEQSTWAQLKQAMSQSLRQWQAQHPHHFGADFWMTGEAWGHGVVESDYYRHGFDAMINFDFQDHAKNALACYAEILPIYQQMDEKSRNFNVLSYLSSHDTRLFFHSDSENNLTHQKTAASLLLLAPNAVQIYYGDESARPFGATGGSDPNQGTRSDMNWQELEHYAPKRALLQHWQTLARFRQQHNAIGAGIHQDHSTAHYAAFSRVKDQDKVMVVWAGNAPK